MLAGTPPIVAMIRSARRRTQGLRSMIWRDAHDATKPADGRWPLALAAVFLAVLTVAARAADIALIPGVAQSGPVAAGAERRYRVELKSGQAAELRLRQAEGVGLQLRWRQDGSAEAASLRTEAGRTAVLRVTLVADADQVGWIEVISTKSDSSAAYSLALAPAHVTTTVDRNRAAATLALARAQALQRAGTSEAMQRSVALFDESIRDGEQAGDACGLRLAYATRSRLEYARGDYLAAQAAAESAVAQTCTGDLAEQAMALHALGVAHATQGDAAAAAAAEEHALALAKRTGDLVRQGSIIGSLSVQYRVLGETQKALDTAQAGLLIANGIGDTRHMAFIHEAIADVYLSRVELAPAIKAYRQVLDEVHATPLPLVEGMTWVNMGLAYSKSGDNEEAYKAWSKAESVCVPINDWSCLAVLAVNRGDALFADGKLTAAAAEYARAFDIGNAHNLKLQQAYALGGLGACDIKAKRWSDARSHLEAARDQMKSLGALREQAYLATLLGDLDSEAHDFTAARRQYKQALESGQRYGDRGVQWLALGSLARSAQYAGDLADARRFIEQALALIESERTSFSDPGLRTSYFTSMRAYYDLYIDILMQLDGQQPERDHAAAALLAAERARARTLQEQLAERAIDIGRNLDPALRVAERSAQDRLQMFAYRLARLDERDDSARTVLLGEIDEASRRLDEARGRMRAANPRYAELAHPTTLTLDEIQRRLLDDGVGAVEYWLGEPRSYVWVVTRTALHAYTLPARSVIERSAAELRGKIIARAPAAGSTSMEQLAVLETAADDAIHQRVSALAAQLLPPAILKPLGSDVAIIADGNLQQLPFVLFTPDNAVRRQFVYLPSIGSLRGLRALPRTTAARTSVAILADPVFRADDIRLGGHAAPSAIDEVLLRAASAAGVANLPRLPNTRREADAIAALVPPGASWLAVDFAANREATLKTSWSNYAVVHFATHALLNPDHPELSGIVLSLFDESGRAEDGFLRVNDIYNLHMPADLVVLSVCDSALGESPGSEGAFSLSRAFFYAGARHVVASLWPVDDRAGATFMRAFYGALLGRGMRPQDALAEAQRELRQNPRWSAPYYWSGYVLQGDWR